MVDAAEGSSGVTVLIPLHLEMTPNNGYLLPQPSKTQQKVQGCQCLFQDGGRASLARHENCHTRNRGKERMPQPMMAATAGGMPMTPDEKDGVSPREHHEANDPRTWLRELRPEWVVDSRPARCAVALGSAATTKTAELLRLREQNCINCVS